MIKLLSILLGVVVLDFYYFPVAFTFLPSINTKMALAGVGVALFFIRSTQDSNLRIGIDELRLIILPIIISLIGFFSVIFNNTNDYAYVTYFISAGTWFGGAYTVILFLRSIHKNFNWITLCHYLALICTLQCIIAFWIDNDPAFKATIDSYFVQDIEMFEKVKRLYGIGAALDVAGIRFSLVLAMMFYYLANPNYQKPTYIYPLYFLAIIIIVCLGCIMARTTMIGALVGLAYLIVSPLFSQSNSIAPNSPLNTWGWLLILLAISLPVVVHYYNTDPIFYKQVRFGFEGFFSLVEKGRWEVDSNEVLKNMYVYPETLKTWFIGDGYFSNPGGDPYFIGKVEGGYYMGTDVGWLRFIFYFGVIGLLFFSAFLVQTTWVCIKRTPQEIGLLLMLIAINFIVWFKVSTDCFLMLALFLSLSYFQIEQKQLNES